MTDLIDVPEVIAALEEAIAERGKDYTYPGSGEVTCRYWWTMHDIAMERIGRDQYRKPACLAGVALDKLGLFDLVTSDALNERAVGGVLTLRDHLTAHAIHVLGRAQDTQDAGKTWGLALAHAQSLAAEIEEAKVKTTPM